MADDDSKEKNVDRLQCPFCPSVILLAGQGVLEVTEVTRIITWASCNNKTISNNCMHRLGLGWLFRLVCYFV